MTTMDSDSESQDSDDGRRFRFETTRKDNIQMDAKLGKLSKSKSEQKSCYNDIECDDKRDKSKHECNKGEQRRLSKERDISNKDLKYSTKHSKYSFESRNSRHEDNKDHRNARDDSSDSKSAPLPLKHKTRDIKRHKNRDRNEYRSNRSQERCRSKNGNDRPQNDKHRNKSREKYKHHACDRSRDKCCQSHKVKSSDGKFRGEPEKYNIHKKAPTKEDEGHRLQKYPLSKNIDEGHSGNESVTKGDFSIENQEYEELNLSEFDILSETDENISDGPDIKNKSLLSRQCNSKTKKRNLNNDHENPSKKQVIEIEPTEGSLKVNARKNDVLYGSSNNNSGTISDSTLSTTSPILTESRKNTADLNSKEENLNSAKQTSLHLNNYNFVKVTNVAISSSPMTAEKTTTYGPALPPQLVANSSNNTELNKDIHFIGPCLPKYDAQDISEQIKKDTLNSIGQDNVIQEDSASDLDVVFGPALPPHLLKQKCNDETDTKIIGPTLPNTIPSLNNNEVERTESEDEDGIGPLPANHPALESNYVYKQLEQRAQQIKNEQKDEVYSTLNQREEWMTELPPTQINDLGLTSRKFRVKAGPDMSDRSCWTDTPIKKAEKQKQQEKEKLYDDVQTSVTELSKESEEIKSWESKKCEKSLLEIHQNKLRKKKRKEEKKTKSTGQTVRRPFDRDIDLQINRFDQVQKNAIISKAQDLNERFSRGKF